MHYWPSIPTFRSLYVDITNVTNLLCQGDGPVRVTDIKFDRNKKESEVGMCWMDWCEGKIIERQLFMFELSISEGLGC